jgi:hypothetical protein
VTIWGKLQIEKYVRIEYTENELQQTIFEIAKETCPKAGCSVTNLRKKPSCPMSNDTH